MKHLNVRNAMLLMTIVILSITVVFVIKELTTPYLDPELVNIGVLLVIGIVPLLK